MYFQYFLLFCLTFPPPQLGMDCVLEEGQVDRAIACLVLEWAEKQCLVKFECLRDLAVHLINKNCVDNHSVAAYTVLGDQKQGMCGWARMRSRVASRTIMISDTD